MITMETDFETTYIVYEVLSLNIYLLPKKKKSLTFIIASWFLNVIERETKSMYSTEMARAYS